MPVLDGTGECRGTSPLCGCRDGERRRCPLCCPTLLTLDTGVYTDTSRLHWDNNKLCLYQFHYILPGISETIFNFPYFKVAFCYFGGGGLGEIPPLH